MTHSGNAKVKALYTAVDLNHDCRFYNVNIVAFRLIEQFFLIIGFPLLSLTTVVVSNSLILHRLRLAARWRQHTSTSGGADSGHGDRGMSKAKTQLNKMLVVVACVYVVSALPTIVRDTTKMLAPGFNSNGYNRYGMFEFAHSLCQFS